MSTKDNMQKQRLRVCSFTKIRGLYCSVYLNTELKKNCALTVVDWQYYTKIRELFAPAFRFFFLRNLCLNHDVIHVQYDIAGYMPLFLPLSYLARIGTNAKIVLTLHEKYDNVPFASLIILFHNFWYRFADALLVHTQEHKKFLPAYLHSKIQVVPHGVLYFQKIVRKTIRHRLLLVGYLNTWKGHDTAINALPQVIAQFPDTQLYIKYNRCTDKKFEKTLHDLARHLGIESHVTFDDTPNKEEDLYSLFEHAEISLLPYRRITMSGILAHTISRSVPCITTDLPAFREVTKGKISYFPVGDSHALAKQIIYLLAHPRIREKMSIDLHELAREYDWKKVAQQTIRAYQSLFLK